MIWQIRPLGEIADLQAGVGFPPALQGRLEGEVPLAKVGDISRAVRAGGVGFVPPLNHITRLEAAGLRARILPPGSTVFAKIGEAIAQNFRLFTDRAVAVDNNVMGAIPRDSVEPRYLFRFLQTIDLYAYSSKTTVPAIRKSDLEQIAVPLPPLAEQRRIADILDKADAIRRKRKQAIALTEELLRSAFLDMFGDPVTNPRGWPTRPFEDAVLDATGGNPKVQQSDYLPQGSFPIIDQGAEPVGGWTNDEALLATAQCPAVLFGDHTKILKWAASPFVLGADGVKVLEPKEGLTAEYLYWACRLFRFPDVGYSRHFKFLKLWAIPVPPLPPQSSFARVFGQVQRALPLRHTAMEEADRLFGTLAAQYFSGGSSQWGRDADVD